MIIKIKVTYEISKMPDEHSLYKLIEVKALSDFTEYTHIGYYQDFQEAIDAMHKYINPPQPQKWTFDDKGEIIE
jgi:hypothetical protein